ncbi:MAG: 23S rRNA (uracil(1939)-C(5))-methyltransferase RlmD [Bacilli bacterium]|nr:23S rRNA (uracil(1939)-C(5))-methyltransferase RlmD [Bacilli bacterium]
MKLGKELIVKVVRLNNEAEGVAIKDGLVIFIKGALPEEDVKIKIIEMKKNYAIGELIEVISINNKRTIPLCPFYGKCGGCDIMHMNKELQLEFKKQKVIDVFKKICKLELNVNDTLSYNNNNYRNKVVLRIEGNSIGYYEPKSNKLVGINECLLCDPLINEAISKIKDFIGYYTSHRINEVMIRVAKDELMICIDTINKRWIDKFIKRLDIASCIYVGNDLVYGMDSINQKLNDLVFDISPKSFFQVNPVTAEKLFEFALKNINEQNICVDLYSGTGTIAISLAKKSRRVIAIESNKSAVEDAKSNMVLNNLDNVEFMHGRVEDLIDELKDLNIDTLVLDPPRSGSDKRSLRALLKFKPKNIIYISCNPVTLARDYNVIRNLYEITEVQPFDMFPNTHHVETVMVLERR